ncbi:MAG: hypothetical protein ACT4PT_07790 [Methanobacteriota archaeon]
MPGCCALPITRDGRTVRFCPECLEPGERVAWTTVNAVLRPEAAGKLDSSASYHFSPRRECPVPYLGAGPSSVARKDEARRRIGEKEAEAPIPVCYCLKVSEGQIVAEVAEKRCCRTLRDVERATRARTGRACHVMNPRGRCCGPQVRRAINKGLRAIGEPEIPVDPRETEAEDALCCGAGNAR